MKNNYLFRLFIIVMLFGINNVSCRKDNQEYPGLDSNWQLIEYIPSAFFPENSKTFSPGQVVWTFNTEKKQVNISIKTGIDFNLIDQGLYSYEYGDNGCNYEENLFIIIGNRGFGTLIKTDIQDNRLVISNACVDGHILKFTR